MAVSTCGGQQLISGTLPLESSTLFFKVGSPVGFELVSKTENAGLRAHVTTPSCFTGFLMWILRTELKLLA